MPTLAVLILTKNEEQNITRCISSVSFADEVIVVDSGSEDNTCKLAEDLGAKVYHHDMTDSGFAGQRNFALECTKADWVLYLDADEQITPELGVELQNHIKKEPQQAAAIKRINVVMGQLMHHGVYRPDYIMRLFPKNKVRWDGVVHEQAITELPVVRLKSPAHHYCLTSWEQYFAKFDQYTTLMAQKMHEKGKTTNGIAMHLHAIFAFIQMYVLKLGFLDGKMGIILCQYHYFYTLTKYVKLHSLQNKK
ncbi:glycosyltransferase family 2 protein [Anaerovibrio lipolyticus]|uniref:glycosyltransferase family 2 protein n=1 Tax=Anaerovibrio lipolyticus TaxID=82374 RepID=UPI0023F0EFC0|nr:glycosyltransferase family 2 protein [Anaerovibrio lipolyticus]